jgi:hypothetical protein
MTVRVRNLQGGGSGHGPTRFTDTLLSPDQPFGVGNNWIMSQNLVNPPLGNAFAGVDVAGALNRGATGLAYTNPGGGGFTPVLFAAPVPIDWAFCSTRNQYAQVKMISNPGGINRPGVCVFANGNTAEWYTLQFLTELSQFAVSRINGTTQTNIIANSPTTAYAVNDTLRLEADKTTTPGTTIITAKKNGVTIATFNDNTAFRLTSGMFGLAFVGSNPAVVSVISNFEGGKL